MNYLEYLNSPVSFRRGLWHQVKALSSCVDSGDFGEYYPLRIR